MCVVRSAALPSCVDSRCFPTLSQILDIKFHLDPAMPGTRGIKELWQQTLGSKIRKACPKYTGAEYRLAGLSELAFTSCISQCPSRKSLTGASRR